jgi:hypothetical protein
MGNKFCNCNECFLNKKSQNLSNLICKNKNNHNIIYFNNITLGSVSEENYNNNFFIKYDNEERLKEIYYLNCIRKIIKCYKNYKNRKKNQKTIIKAKLRKIQKEKQINNYINNIIKNSVLNKSFNKNKYKKNNVNFIKDENTKKSLNFSSTNFLNIPPLKSLSQYSRDNLIRKENFNNINNYLSKSSIKKENNDLKIFLNNENKSLTNRSNEVNYLSHKKHNFSLIKDFEDYS